MTVEGREGLVGRGTRSQIGKYDKKYIKCSNEIVGLIYANKILIKRNNRESSRRKHHWIYLKVFFFEKEVKKRNVNTFGYIKHVTYKVKSKGYQKPRLKANKILKVLFGDIKANGKMSRGHRQENEQ